MRTLLFSTLYPSSERPGHGIFVETRLRELLKTGRVETRVVAPVPWFPWRSTRVGDRAGSERHRGGLEGEDRLVIGHHRCILPMR